MTVDDWVVPCRVFPAQSSDKGRIGGTEYGAREEVLTGI